MFFDIRRHSGRDLRAHGAGRIKSSGGLLEGKGLAIAGLVTGYLAFAWAIIFIPMLLAIAIPNFVKARTTAQMNACINNLRQIEGAKQQWILEKNKAPGDIPTAADLDAYLRGGGFSQLKCPAGGTYTINAGDKQPTCSVPGHALNQ